MDDDPCFPTFYGFKMLLYVQQLAQMFCILELFNFSRGYLRRLITLPPPLYKFHLMSKCVLEALLRHSCKPNCAFRGLRRHLTQHPRSRLYSSDILNTLVKVYI